MKFESAPKPFSLARLVKLHTDLLLSELLASIQREGSPAWRDLVARRLEKLARAARKL